MTDVRMPDGTIIKNVPDGITKKELLRKLKGNKKGITAAGITKAAIAGKLGYNSDEINIDIGAPAGFRADLSLADTDEERINKFFKYFPSGAIDRVDLPELNSSYLVYKVNRDDPNESPKTIEDIGHFTFGDLADMVGTGFPVIGSIAASGGNPAAGVIKTALKLGAGDIAGRLAKEGIEKFRGDQFESGGEVAKRTLTQGAITAGIGLGFGGIAKAANILSGGGVVKPSPAGLKTSKAIEDAGLKSPPAFLANPEDMILGRLSKQAISTSRHAQIKLENMQTSLVDNLSSLSTNTVDATGKELAKVIRKQKGSILARFYAQAARKVKASLTTPRNAEDSLIKGLGKDFVTIAGSLKRKLYGNVDKAASIEKPIFDLSPALKTINEIENAVLASLKEVEITKTLPAGKIISTSGKPILPSVEVAGTVPGGEVNVAPAQAELLSVIKRLKTLATEQTNFEAIKQIRTDLFGLIDNMPWQWDFNKMQAAKLWSSLTNVLTNPVNGAKGYVKALNTANSFFRKEYIPVLKSGIVQKIIKSENLGLIAKQMAEPNSMPIHVIKALKKFAPKRFEEYKGFFIANLLKNEKGAKAAINNFLQNDKEAFTHFVSRKDLPSLMKMANAIDDLNSSTLNQVLTTNVKIGRLTRDLLENQDVEGIIQLVEQLGGRGSKGATLMRDGLIAHMIDDSVEETTKGGLRISFRKFSNLYKKYDKNGALDTFLTPKEKTRIFGIKEYARLFDVRVDPGTSLEQAKAITQVKNPFQPIQFLAGAHTLGVNSLVARAIFNDKVNQFLIGREKQFFSEKLFGTSAAILSEIARDLRDAGSAPLLKEK